MLSVVNICNLALARLGDAATVASIDPPEGSAQAEHCARFYPLARDVLLALHPWGFAQRRERGTLLASGDHTWTHKYAYPNDALAVSAVLPAHAQDEVEAGGRAVPQEFRLSREGGALVILTDTPDALIRYTARSPDPALFPPAFTDALAWKLAGYLAGALYKGEAGMAEAKRCEEMFAHYAAQAREQDTRQRRMTVDHAVPWLEGR